MISLVIHDVSGRAKISINFSIATIIMTALGDSIMLRVLQFLMLLLVRLIEKR
jgi:hypothetical protein